MAIDPAALAAVGAPAPSIEEQLKGGAETIAKTCIQTANSVALNALDHSGECSKACATTTCGESAGQVVANGCAAAHEGVDAASKKLEAAAPACIGKGVE